MDATENKKAIIVGIFLALGLIVFILGVFTLGGQQKSFVKNIKISSVFSDVAGLKKGNNVWFSGVKVGTISNVKFIGPSQVQVFMNIDEATQQYIHRNAGAKVSSDGLIGNKIIVIDGGSPQAPIVQDGDVLQAEKMLSTDDMLKTLQDNNQNLLAITTDFKALSHKILEGKGTVGALMADSTMAMQLRASMRNLQAATQSAAIMAVQLNNFSAKMNTKGGFADKLLTDTATFNKISQSVGQLQKAAANASTLTDNLTKASNKLNTTDNAIGVLLNDPKGAAQVQTTLNYLQQSSVKLNDDLEAVQHNFLLRGFFKKKAKAKADSLKAQ
ncbi:MlaD family protein [Mucilaginibacter lappiensis]|uniref:Phospholipid/cholesterol/gamma-HCH transport system substrate-binding protein n=1 Tax=Mucilaginibacter lappiensis TaxID=354630 RepID=A0A1N6YYU4_9SPHI|nr:MlaD family protein [Mucilaginibacter lappiensis]MBB6109910.1 phospholipid/cholesterol/gamma-HCH transport system substrate-binding protein [Mucilaginibacter lappiensis]MBB6131218.1 phospholipid/cholesterol/gamma-HCH transport system substrate-binding protein [Mucilaginibacter lappiensis]SIR19758.1 phospholipid/cholesterol/gamma-HCH transport system substrate-binding protein [Mucilaginibacter lappiensis]